MDGWSYQVIGVGKKKGTTLGQSRDNYVLMPITAYLKQYGAHNNSIRISGKAQRHRQFRSNEAMDEARVILRAMRHDVPGKPDSFEIETNASLLGIWANLSGTFFIAMIAIAAVSLVVGGIVIMNIMLVSVTERTREIGIRKAMGARAQDVLLQFLIESVTHCLGRRADRRVGWSFAVAEMVTAADRDAFRHQAVGSGGRTCSCPPAWESFLVSIPRARPRSWIRLWHCGLKLEYWAIG